MYIMSNKQTISSFKAYNSNAVIFFDNGDSQDIQYNNYIGMYSTNAEFVEALTGDLDINPDDSKLAALSTRVSNSSNAFWLEDKMFDVSNGARTIAIEAPTEERAIEIFISDFPASVTDDMVATEIEETE